MRRPSTEFDLARRAARDVFGETHKRHFVIWSQYATTLVCLDRYEEALTEFEGLLAVSRQINGDDSLETIELRYDYMRTLFALGWVDDAWSEYDALVQDCTRIYGEDHSTTRHVQEFGAQFAGEIAEPKNPVE